jgi:hypothetical protein
VTTVAYRDGIIAADRRVTQDGQRTPGGHTKIGRTKSGWLYGASGVLADCIRFERCMKKWDGTGTPKNVPFDGFNGIAISPKGLIHWAEKGMLWPAPQTAFAALGSGSDAALGALYHGASAREAVEIASLVDTATGDGVDSLFL